MKPTGKRDEFDGYLWVVWANLTAACKKTFFDETDIGSNFLKLRNYCKICSSVRKTPPFLCQRRCEQNHALIKEMFSNVPDNAAAGIFGNENIREATVPEAEDHFQSHQSFLNSSTCEQTPFRV